MQPPLENLCSAELEPLLPRRARGSGRGRRPWGQGAWEVGNTLGRLPLTQQNARSSRRRVPATNLQPRSLCEGLEINPESQVPAVPGRQVSRNAWHRRGPTWGRASGAPRAPGRGQRARKYKVRQTWRVSEGRAQGPADCRAPGSGTPVGAGLGPSPRPPARPKGRISRSAEVGRGGQPRSSSGMLGRRQVLLFQEEVGPASTPAR